MTRKIFRSMVAVTCAILLSSVIVITCCMYAYFGSIRENTLRDQLDIASTGVEMEGESYLDKLDTGNFRITWIGADGEVVFDSAADAGESDNHLGREEVRQALSEGYGQSVRYSGTLMEKTIYCAKKLSDGTVLRISVSAATVGTLFLGVLEPVIIVISFAVVLSGIIAGWISRKIVRPINNLDLEHPLENDTYDEISPLLSRINKQHIEIDRKMQELRSQSEEFSQIIEAMNEGLVLIDDDGTVLAINPAAVSIFSADEDCIGRDILTVCRDRTLTESIKKAVSDGNSEMEQERKGRIFQFNISRIDTDEGSHGAVILIFDITEKVQAEKNRREFTANVSHELKTPLQGIIGSAELLENGMVEEEDVPRFVGHIKKEATRLVALVEDIIRISQLDENSEFPKENVDLMAIGEECVDNLAPVAKSKGVSMKLLGEHVRIVGVRKLIDEIIFNLCDNAVKYNRANGTVDINISQNEKTAVITVADTGIGIPEDDTEKIFQRFYRVDRSHSKETGGTGLGLSIVKHAVAYHGGKISVKSQLGKGTTVTVEIPVK